MVSRTRRFRPTGVRKERQWGIHSSNQTLSTAGHAGMLSFDLSANIETSIGANLHNVTVSALKYRIRVRCVAAPTVFATFQVAFGIMWATNDAIAQGGLSLPQPSIDDGDWIWHNIRSWQADVATALAPLHPRDDMVIDNKSMRKQRENNSTLILIADGITIPSSMQIIVGGRALFLLP